MVWHTNQLQHLQAPAKPRRAFQLLNWVSLNVSIGLLSIWCFTCFYTNLIIIKKQLMERVDLQVEAMAQVHLISRYACYVQKATMTQTLEK